MRGNGSWRRVPQRLLRGRDRVANREDDGLRTVDQRGAIVVFEGPGFAQALRKFSRGS